MYKEYFGFIELPFSIAPDPRYLYMSEQHREALAHLLYGVTADGGFVLLTGEIGTGKTTVCRGLLEQIPDNTDIAFILNPKVSAGELLATVCDELGIQYPEQNQSIKVFVDSINTHLLTTHGKDRKTILIIEEAQNLTADVMEQIRLLTNLETDQKKLLQIIMVGQPELRDILERPGMEQLSQRITARYHLGPLSKKEVNEYINHRLTIAGVSSQLFPVSLMDRIYRMSRGIPRLINVICDRALLGTYVQGKQTVDRKTLVNAAREILSGSSLNSFRGRLFLWSGISIFLLIIAFTMAFVSYNQRHQAASPPTAGGSETPIDATEPLRVWPADQPIEKSRQMAFQSLANLWNLNVPVFDETGICSAARERGLACLHDAASLEGLKDLNRPAVLNLFDDNNREFYVTIISMKDQTAIVLIASQPKEVDLSELKKHWLGDYTLLWKPPEHYREEIHPGSASAGVEWLDRQISLIQGEPEKRQWKKIYDEELLRKVRTFQLDRGLKPDGIVGPLTIIHLYNAEGRDEPVLNRRGKT
ncbi:MAG: AAA family ATPase [Thermodesulfovibrionales bacterium]|nr:AAA family ATPase [Thermodesulfovibrionales bacterium]